MRLNRSISCCCALAAFCILGSSPAVAEDSVLQILWDRAEVVAHVKVDGVGELPTKGHLRSWFFTAAAQQVYKADPERKIPERLAVFIKRIPWPGVPRKMRVPMEKDGQYILFLKELDDQSEFLALRSVRQFQSDRGYTTAGSKQSSWLCVQPYDSSLDAELTTLANIDRALGKVKTAARKETAAKHAVACTAIAHVSVKPAPPRKPVAVPFPYQGYVVEPHPKWIVTLFVKDLSLEKRPPKKPSFRLGAPTFYIADLKKTFGRDDEAEIHGRHRVTFTWYPTGRTVAEQIDDLRAVPLKDDEVGGP